MQHEVIKELISKICDEKEEEAYRYMRNLADLGGEEVISAVEPLLYHDSDEVRYLAAQTLGNMEDNQQGLDILLQAVLHKDNAGRQGDMVSAIELFDYRDKFLEIFKIYINGSFKAKTLAKSYLDFGEFDITPRILKKVEKQWNHYIHNVKHDDTFEVVKADIEDMLEGLKSVLNETDAK